MGRRVSGVPSPNALSPLPPAALLHLHRHGGIGGAIRASRLYATHDYLCRAEALAEGDAVTSSGPSCFCRR